MAISVCSAVRGGCQYASLKLFEVVVVTGDAFEAVPAMRLSSGVSAIHVANGMKQ